MNFLRHNIITLALVVVVAATTALNHYTTLADRTMYMDAVAANNREYAIMLVARDTQVMLHVRESQLLQLAHVAASEASRAERIEGEFNELVARFIDLREQAQYFINLALDHIQKCHELLEANGIEPPRSPFAQEIQPDQEA